MEMKSCSMRVKKLIKVGLSQVGGDQLDFSLKGREGGGGAYCKCCWGKKYCVSMRVLNLFQHLFVSFLKILVGVGTKDKPFVCFDGIGHKFAEWNWS